MRGLSRALFSVYTTSASSIKRVPSFSQYSPGTCDRHCEQARCTLLSKQIMESRPKRRHRTINAMELYQSRRDCNGMPPYKEPTQGNMRQRSPYERRIGKSISLCSKCLGEGKVRGPLTKKARAHAKSQLIDSKEGSKVPNQATMNFVPPMKLCLLCDGSGLVANPLLSTPMDNEAEETNVTEMVAQHLPMSVAIIGGGIGGIALAAALQHRNIPCVVYERDISFDERKQGYGLTMQQGARALRSLGFFSLADDDDEFEDDGHNSDAQSNHTKLVTSTKEDDISRSRFGIHSKRHVVHEPDGTVVGEWGMQIWGARFEKNGRKHAKRQNAHISRQNLRKLLMDMLKPGTVRWGYKLIDYNERGMDSDDSNTDNVNLNLTFHCQRTIGLNDTENEWSVITADASLLVGCDGIRSSVRAKKLGEDVAPLRYLGCIVILGIAKSPISQLTNGETVFQTADGVTRLYAMPFAQSGGEEVSGIFPDDETGLSMWQLSFPMDESDAKYLSASGPAALKAEALKRCGQWHDPIPALISQTQDELVTGYPCYDRALVGKRVFREGSNSAVVDSFVTLLGDAAHPMSPFKGRSFLCIAFRNSFHLLTTGRHIHIVPPTGQGANQALLDAIQLSRKLYRLVYVDEKTLEDKYLNDRIPAALAEFEEEMLERSSVKVEKSANAAKFLHSEVAISKGNVTRGAVAAAKAGRKEPR